MPIAAERLKVNILGKMKKSELALYERETKFFEDITSISGILTPKQDKEEMKEIIKDKLEHYDLQIP